MKHSTFEVDGKKFVIEITDDGEFRTLIDGDPLRADTYEKLKQKIMRSQRRAKVRIALPATIALSSSHFSSDAEQLVDVEITGIHQRNRTVLYRRLDTDKAGTVEYSDTLLKRLDGAGKATYQALLRAKLGATKTFDTHKRAQTLDVEKVKQQVREAEKAAGIERPEDDDE